MHLYKLYDISIIILATNDLINICSKISKTMKITQRYVTEDENRFISLVLTL